MSEDLKRHVIEEFSGENAQEMYAKEAVAGLWDSEEHFIDKYFKKGRLLDMGCGTGRTTLPLSKRLNTVGVDLVPTMIRNAKKIAKKHKLKIDYRVGDATKLKFKDGSFDYILFSNQGWTQIPGSENRLQALKEMRRVLKKDGVLIFTVHPRVWPKYYFWLWTWQWIKVEILKRMGFPVPEIEYGDRFFTRESTDPQRTYNTKQYIHIPSVNEVIAQVTDAGFRLLEVNGKLQKRPEANFPYPPVFFICQK